MKIKYNKLSWVKENYKILSDDLILNLKHFIGGNSKP